MSELPERYRSRFVDGVELAFRCKGGDESKPFIDVLAGDPDAAWLRSVLGKHWPDVSLARFLRREPPGDEAIADQHVLGGMVSELRARPPVAIPAGFVVRRARGGDDLAPYGAAMERFRAASPLGAEVWPCSPDDFVRAAEHGVIVIAEGPRGWAGVAACAPDVIAAWSGQVMLELFVHERARGQRLAPALQRAVIDRLDPEVQLIGTIHAANAPSLATALRCGRSILATYWWLPLEPATWLDGELATG